jgi:hypothetical protein
MLLASAELCSLSRAERLVGLSGNETSRSDHVIAGMSTVTAIAVVKTAYRAGAE